MMSVLLLVRATAKPGKGQEVVEMLAPFVGENPGMEGCSRIELAVDAGTPGPGDHLRGVGPR